MNTPTLFTCLACGYRTITEQPNNTFQICPVCHWEDDAAQANNPDLTGGANDASLRSHQAGFLERYTGERPAEINGYARDDQWHTLESDA